MQEIKYNLRVSIFLLIFAFFFVACDASNREYKEFYDTGEVQIKGKFENNKREGEWVVYDKVGGISQKLFYRNDSLYKRETYTNETLTIEETLLDSVRHGELKIFFEN